jgi:hypothetical protein
MEKAILTKQQAEAIETMLENSTCDRIVSIRVRDGSKFIGGCESINDMDLNTLIIALYIGYEVDLTEKEKIHRLWETKFYLTGSESLHEANEKIKLFTQGVEQTLYALGREDLIPEETKTNGGNDNGN